MRELFFLVCLLVLLPVKYSAQEKVKQNEDIYTLTEEMPVFDGCQEVDDQSKRTECTQEKLYLYFRDKAKEANNSKRGLLFVSFVINQEGKAVDPEIARGVIDAPELDSIAINMVNTLPIFTPGKQRGKAVSVKYTLPIKFK